MTVTIGGAESGTAAPGPPGLAARPDVAGPAAAIDAEGRPVADLPIGHLIRISLYWFGLGVVWNGLTDIVNGRMQFTGLVPKGSEGAGAAEVAIAGAIIAIIVQPTVGQVSDFTKSRWGRRKPYIVIGSTLDLVFLFGIATSDTIVALAAFIALLQFSSNFAQGPFQGYVPDLVPAQQVGLASGLMGLFSTLGVIAGLMIGALAIRFSGTSPDSYAYATLALGVIEFTTMLSVVLHVGEGRSARPREGRSWGQVIREVWATDVLRERSFVWFLGSRFFILLGGALLMNLSVFYLSQTFGLGKQATGDTKIALLAIGAVATTLAILPASRLSDHFGRKRVIYAACAIGTVSLLIVGFAPTIAIGAVGVALYGMANGSFLAVDWALMTDIIPKASAGRYMGISNVATASVGPVALVFGGAALMDGFNALLGYGAGPRVAVLCGALCYLVGAWLLRPVDETRREDDPGPAPVPVPADAVEAG